MRSSQTAQTVDGSSSSAQLIDRTRRDSIGRDPTRPEPTRRARSRPTRRARPLRARKQARVGTRLRAARSSPIISHKSHKAVESAARTGAQTRPDNKGPRNGSAWFGLVRVVSGCFHSANIRPTMRSARSLVRADCEQRTSSRQAADESSAQEQTAKRHNSTRSR